MRTVQVPRDLQQGGPAHAPLLLLQESGHAGRLHALCSCLLGRRTRHRGGRCSGFRPYFRQLAQRAGRAHPARMQRYPEPFEGSSFVFPRPRAPLGCALRTPRSKNPRDLFAEVVKERKRAKQRLRDRGSRQHVFRCQRFVHDHRRARGRVRERCCHCCGTRRGDRDRHRRRRRRRRRHRCRHRCRRDVCSRLPRDEQCPPKAYFRVRALASSALRSPRVPARGTFSETLTRRTCTPVVVGVGAATASIVPRTPPPAPALGPCTDAM